MGVAGIDSYNDDSVRDNGNDDDNDDRAIEFSLARKKKILAFHAV
jgi:hypothetical protein